METTKKVTLTELVADQGGYITMDGETLGKRVMTATPEIYRDATPEEIEVWSTRSDELPPNDPEQ